MKIIFQQMAVLIGLFIIWATVLILFSAPGIADAAKKSPFQPAFYESIQMEPLDRGAAKTQYD